MNTAANNWQHAKEIVANALELGLADRHAYVEAQLALAPSLRDEVESLLRADTVDGAQSGFLQSPPVMPQTSAEEKSLLAGQLVGAWKLVEEIGRGGMGVVYLAERADGAYSQRAAVKLLRGAGRQDASRMARERQALASLAHPNVARLIDGGTTTTGTPYLVMEYVEGETIERYAQQHQLGLEQRVGLVKKLCGAVQSAHQQLLIHRDIKPSNILIDKEGEPKLLDFGIARLLEVGKNPDDVQDLTQAGALLFTPRYASPEQVNGTPVSVATDVYGIGALLYELLAGTSPYPRMATTDITNFAAIMRVVSLDPIGSASELAKSNQPAFSPYLKGDLDAILSKACAKLPQERYPTVAALADDLNRWLEHRPVLARAPTSMYRIRKFISRHKLGSSLSMLAVLAISAGIFGTVTQKMKAENRYIQARNLATNITSKYTQALEFLPGSGPVRKQMTNDGIQFLDQLAEGAGEDLDAIAEIAGGFRTLAEAQYNGRHMASSGDLAGATITRKKVNVLLKKVLSKQPDHEAANIQMASLDADLAAIEGFNGRTDEALARMGLAISRYEEILKRSPNNARVQYDLIHTYLDTAQAALNGQKPGRIFLQKAENEFTRWESKNAQHEDRVSLKLFLIRTLYLEAQQTKQDDRAIEMADREIALIDETLKIDPNIAPFWKHKLTALTNSGAIQLNRKLTADALVRFDQGIALSEKLLASEPDDLSVQTVVARLQTHRGRAFGDLGQQSLALAAFKDSVARWQSVAGKDLATYQYRHTGQAMYLLSRALKENGNLPAGREMAHQFLKHAEKYSEIFNMEPASNWVIEAKLIAQ
jgi:serine/threonine protein kinase